MGFKKPFRAVPIRAAPRSDGAGRRLKGLDEFDKPLWSPFRIREPVPWLTILIGALIGTSLSLAYILWVGN